jgi:hypothetical protein
MVDTARATYEARGWLNEMAAQVAEIRGDTTALDTENIFNIRFRSESDLELLTRPVPVADGAKLKTLRRYLLYALQGTNDVVRKTWPSRRGATLPGVRAPAD